jgi:N utilization substance protein A
VPDEQLSLAIGRRGQNVRLASILTQLDIDIMTEAEESERRAEETKVRSALFIEALDVDDMIANLLCAEGFRSVEELGDCPVDELASIDGFDEDVAAELINRANVFLEAKQAEFDKQKKALGLNDDILDVKGVSAGMALTLAQNDIKSRDDLADLAGDELVEILGTESMTEKDANALIMRAREHWFANEVKTDDNAEAAA